MKKNEMQIDYLWNSRKHICGLPISFTRYYLSEDRFFEKTGLLTTTEEELLLYRVRDISLKRTLWQKICGVGTVTLRAVDSGSPIIKLVNIRNSEWVKETIHKNVEAQKLKMGIRVGEIIDT